METVSQMSKSSINWADKYISLAKRKETSLASKESISQDLDGWSPCEPHCSPRQGEAGFADFL